MKNYVILMSIGLSSCYHASQTEESSSPFEIKEDFNSQFVRTPDRDFEAIPSCSKEEKPKTIVLDGSLISKTVAGRIIHVHNLEESNWSNHCEQQFYEQIELPTARNVLNPDKSLQPEDSILYHMASVNFTQKSLYSDMQLKNVNLSDVTRGYYMDSSPADKTFYFGLSFDAELSPFVSNSDIHIFECPQELQAGPGKIPAIQSELGTYLVDSVVYKCSDRKVITVNFEDNDKSKQFITSFMQETITGDCSYSENTCLQDYGWEGFIMIFTNETHDLLHTTGKYTGAILPGLIANPPSSVKLKTKTGEDREYNYHQYIIGF